jgi:transposase
MFIPKRLSIDQILGMRHDYAGGMPVEQIVAKYQTSKKTLYHWLDGGPKSGPRHLPPLPRRGCGPRRRATVLTPDVRRRLVSQLWQTASRQVREIEDRLALRAGGEAGETTEPERDARVLAVLAKTLRELVAIDQTQADAAHDDAVPNEPSPDDDDAAPNDVDELRRELARRVDILRQRRAAAGPSGGDAG